MPIHVWWKWRSAQWPSSQPRRHPAGSAMASCTMDSALTRSPMAPGFLFAGAAGWSGVGTISITSW